MGKKAEQKRRNHVIQVILDAYESGNADWRTYPDPNARGNRTIWITQELYDEIGKRELNQQVLDLQQEKLLRDGTGRDSSGWLVRGSELEKITYQLESIPVFYERDSRIPRYIRHYGPLRELTGELEELKGAAKSWKPWLLFCIEAMEQDVDREKIPKICQDTEKKKVYFQTLRGLNGYSVSIIWEIPSGLSRSFRSRFSGTPVGGTSGWKQTKRSWMTEPSWWKSGWRPIIRSWR